MRWVMNLQKFTLILNVFFALLFKEEKNQILNLIFKIFEHLLYKHCHMCAGAGQLMHAGNSLAVICNMVSEVNKHNVLPINRLRNYLYHS